MKPMIPYENASGAWYDGQVPVEFLSVYRDEEYIRQHTKGMTPAETKAFAMKYYGWDDEPSPAIVNISEQILNCENEE